MVRSLVALSFIGPRPNNHVIKNRPGCVGDAANSIEYVPAAGPTEKARGEQNGSSRLLTTEVVEIRRLRAEGVAVSVIAAKFSVSATTVKDVVSRKTWRHVV
jgi:DNA-binding NarL/FixJ family response regulator